MAFSARTTGVPSEPSAGKIAALHPDWNDRIVTAVAVSTAVLIVALVAVLMGMA